MMKANIFVSFLLLLCLGCTSQQNDQLTQQQKDQIKSEVKAAVDSLFAKVERLDANGALQCFSDSSDFVAYGADGSHSDFQALKRGLTDAFASATSFKAVIRQEDFRVVTKDFVVYSRVQRAEVLLKSGDKLISDPDAMTYLFKKIDGQWKITYTHESEIPVTEKVGKK
jgi:ketosteroid isomerase-like protein